MVGEIVVSGRFEPWVWPPVFAGYGTEDPWANRPSDVVGAGSTTDSETEPSDGELMLNFISQDGPTAR